MVHSLSVAHVGVLCGERLENAVELERARVVAREVEMLWKGAVNVFCDGVLVLEVGGGEQVLIEVGVVYVRVVDLGDPGAPAKRGEGTLEKQILKSLILRLL